MGFGEVIGNQSVHWRVAHEDHGKPGAGRTRLKQANAPVQGVENLTVLDFEAKGADRVPFNNIGQGGGNKQHLGKFRVELRFTSSEDANAALRAAAVRQQGQAWVITLDVPAINRPAGDVDPVTRPPAGEPAN